MTPLISEWAAWWAIPPAAMQDLHRALAGLDCVDLTPLPGRSESAVQSLVRLEGARKGIRLWRNNVGAVENPETGGFLRYGLANDSARVNKQIKSGDLIGIRSVLIQPHHVGHILGQFVSRECKHGGWTWAGTEREVAQANFAALVNTMGGDAKFAAAEGTL